MGPRLRLATVSYGRETAGERGRQHGQKRNRKSYIGLNWAARSSGGRAALPSHVPQPATPARTVPRSRPRWRSEWHRRTRATARGAAGSFLRATPAAARQYTPQTNAIAPQARRPARATLMVGAMVITGSASASDGGTMSGGYVRLRRPMDVEILTRIDGESTKCGDSTVC